jgi:predicted secreted protein
MSWVSIAAIFFIVWWVVLFAMLPVGLRTQDDEKDVTLGTVSSAPRGPHMLKVVIRTTIVSVLIFGIFYVLTKVLGYSIDDIPSFVPHFDL